MYLATSPRTVAPGNVIDGDVVGALKKSSKDFPVWVISNHAEPTWFSRAFTGTNVKHVRIPARQDGQALRAFVEEHELAPYEVLVLASNRDDIAMGKNGGVVVAGAGWLGENATKDTGLKAAQPSDILGLLHILNNWSGESWFRATSPTYSVEAMCDLSTYGRQLPRLGSRMQSKGQSRVADLVSTPF